MSYIYLMESIKDYETTYKIGYSINPKKRINNIKTGNEGEMKILHIFKTKHGKKLEIALHNVYSHFKINREWFNLNIETLCNFLSTCQKIENSLDIIEKNKNMY